MYQYQTITSEITFLVIYTLLGTPRQPHLAPDTRSHIVFDKNIPPGALEDLEVRFMCACHVNQIIISDMCEIRSSPHHLHDVERRRATYLTY